MLTENDEILNSVHYHFTDYFKTKPLEPILLSSEFYSFYQPHPELETYYNRLMQKISQQE